MLHSSVLNVVLVVVVVVKSLRGCWCCLKEKYTYSNQTLAQYDRGFFIFRF